MDKNKALLGLLVFILGFSSSFVWITIKWKLLKKEIVNKLKDLNSKLLLKDEELQTMKDQTGRLEALREQERKGRIQSEIAFRQLLDRTEKKGKEEDTNENENEENKDDFYEHYKFQVIGYLKSCFRDRNGTPRQGLLCPNAKSYLKLNNLLNPRDTLCNLQQFSHVWLIFIFHANTNTSRKVKLETLSKQKNNKNLSIVKSKIRPPRLGGAKVGLYSTRTPHRPNPIGISIAKIEKIENGILYLSGADLIEGTPILDIKPYLKEYDSLPESIQPDWIETLKSVIHSVEWEDVALTQLRNFVENSKLELYKEFKEVKDAIDQVLVLDIRRTNKKEQEAKFIHNYRFDNIMIHFKCLKEVCYVVEIELHSEKENNQQDLEEENENENEEKEEKESDKGEQNLTKEEQNITSTDKQVEKENPKEEQQSADTTTTANTTTDTINTGNTNNSKKNKKNRKKST